MLKKNWECHNVTARICGIVIKGWYIKSPSKNYYFIYRAGNRICMSLKTHPRGYVCIRTKTGNPARTFNEAIKVIYELDEERNQRLCQRFNKIH